MGETAAERSARLGEVAIEYFLACYSVMLYDLLISLNKERKRIWSADWGVLKVLYLIVRYWSAIGLGICIGFYTTVMPRETCLKIVKLEPAFCAIFTLASEGILAVRCYAIWQRDTRILIVLAILWAAEIGAMAAAITRFAPLNVFVDGMGTCIATSPAPGDVLTTVYWITPMCFDVVVTAMTFWQSWQLHKKGLRSRLFHTFVLTQGIYFVIIVGANALSTAFYLQNDPDIQGINSGPALCATSILACRLVLALRDEELQAANAAIDARSFTTFQKRGTGVGLPTTSISTNGLASEKQVYPMRHVVSIANDRNEKNATMDEEHSDYADSVPALDKSYTPHPFSAVTFDDGKSHVQGISVKVDKSTKSERDP